MFIDLDKNLSIKLLDSNNSKDIWLADTLDRDETIVGEKGFLFSIKYVLTHNNKSTKFYGQPYAIYQNHSLPIGYLEISEVYRKEPSVFLNYALCKEQRGHGYMCRTLKCLSNLIFSDEIEKIATISLIIDKNNTDSKKTALLAGFTLENSKDKQFDIYQLTKKYTKK